MKPALSKGTRDFNAEDIAKRRWVTDIIQQQFQLFGFEPLETPSFENIETLTGKYGEEGDRLIFKILNSGLHESKKKQEISSLFQQMLETPLHSDLISDKALRYDLTVPFARYVAMNQQNLALPFKRYQIQPVWRADRPQKGRFREFYQCDADVVGSESLQFDTEMVLLYDAVFSQLNLETDIHLNNRKVLAGIAEYAQIQSQLIDFTVALDKLDKIGPEKVLEEFQNKNISEASIEKLKPLLWVSPTYSAQIELLENWFKHSTIGKEGLQEIQTVFLDVEAIGLEKSQLHLNLTLARGLEYYTGSIFEVKAKNVEMGSIGGGGRYNNLTEMFGVKNMPGIGISFGLDRIILVMEELGLFRNLPKIHPEILFLNLSEHDRVENEKLCKTLRQKKLSCEYYPEPSKLKKQFMYAEKKNIPYVAFYGEKEISELHITVKNIMNGAQKSFPVATFSQKDLTF